MHKSIFDFLQVIKPQSLSDERIKNRNISVSESSLINENAIISVMSKLTTIEESDLFEDLMKNRETVFCICLGFAKNPWDAEELAQETYLKAYKNIGTLKNKATAKEWLFRIARNTCLDHARKERWRKFIRLTGEKESVLVKNPESQLLWAEQLELLKKSIRELPDKQREVLILREYGLFSYQEIAKTLGIKEGTVMSRLKRSRQAIMDMMRREQ